MINGMFFMITTITLYKSNLTTHQARYARQKTSQQVITTSSRINQETKEQLVEFLDCISRLSIFNISGSVQQAVHRDGDPLDI